MLYPKNLFTTFPLAFLCFLLPLFYAIMPVHSEPITAFFSDANAFSELDIISFEFDVNIVQASSAYLTVKAVLIGSNGQTVESKTSNYKTFFSDIDYQRLDFKPLAEDAYSIVLTVCLENSNVTIDSRILNVLWPPGTGAFFKKYKAYAFNNSIEITFDVDLAYEINYAVSVEGILYNSQSDVVAYEYISYLTTGLSNDEHKITLVPKITSHDRYYAELIVYVNDHPASYGYIEDISFSGPRWDINGDNIVDIRDLIIVIKEFGKTSPKLSNLNADANNDGVVDILDFIIVASHLGE
jgi:hypothetical protein